MRLVVTEYITLDGVVENPDWIFPYFDNDFTQFKFDELFTGDALLMGRKTYEYFAPVWVTDTPAEDAPGQEGFAERVEQLPKYIVSTTLEKTNWNHAHMIREHVVEAVRTLKAQPGQNILVAGSAGLVQTLMEHNLVDEYRLLVYPVVVGNGTRLFQGGQNANLKLAEARAFSSGVTALIYQLA